MSKEWKNPLLEEGTGRQTGQPCVLVIFGATGDLTARKLLPALYNVMRDGLFHPHFACVGFARRPKDHTLFRQEMRQAIEKFSRTQPIDEEVWRCFEQHLFYHRSEFDNDEGYENLKKLLKKIDLELGTKGNRVFYLSTPPSHFPLIVEKLGTHGLLKEEGERFSRVIIEKPFGHDLKSAKTLQQHLLKFLKEKQIYRIDHYLGKETVQNLMVFRFGNPIFESVWNNKHIDHVQLTVAEDIGIGTRGNFFEEAGLLRDIVQNHLMQLLTLLAMEPPKSFEAEAIRNEKVHVLQAIREIPFTDAIRGQYGPGLIANESVISYRQEENVAPESPVETFVALKMQIDNARWSGVPFFLRAGKRLTKRVTEISIAFKPTPGYPSEPNILVLRIQPDEGISLKINCKLPGLNRPLQPVKMDFRYGSYFGRTPPDAYERLICDCMTGDNTLFAREDEVLTSWHLLTPILNYWQQEKSPPFPNYAAGSWGPDCANTLTKAHGATWRLL